MGVGAFWKGSAGLELLIRIGYSTQKIHSCYSRLVGVAFDMIDVIFYVALTRAYRVLFFFTDWPEEPLLVRCGSSWGARSDCVV